MKDILSSPFINETVDVISNMYRLGWDERNGGNVSYRLKKEEVAEYVDLSRIIRTIPLGFDAKELAGEIFLVTGTGKYFRNVVKSPQTVLGVLRISADGSNAELLWGFEDGGKFTSEFPSHMMCHAQRLKKDAENRVVMHCHPTNLLAMNYVHELDDRSLSHTLWQMSTECIVVFPEGVGVLPWMVCGNNAIGEATAEKMKEFRTVVWSMHGVYAAGKDLDETFGLIETVEKAASVYMLVGGRKMINTIKDEELKALADAFGVDYRKDFLDL